MDTDPEDVKSLSDGLVKACYGTYQSHAIRYRRIKIQSTAESKSILKRLVGQAYKDLQVSQFKTCGSARDKRCQETSSPYKARDKMKICQEKSAVKLSNHSVKI